MVGLQMPQMGLQAGESGGMPDASLQAILMLAKQRGIPPEQILKMIRDRQTVQGPAVPEQLAGPAEAPKPPDFVTQTLNELSAPVEMGGEQAGIQSMAPIGQGAMPAPVQTSMPGQFSGAPRSGSDVLNDVMTIYGQTPSGAPGDTSFKGVGQLPGVYAARGQMAQRDLEARNQEYAKNAALEQQARQAQQQARTAQGNAAVTEAGRAASAETARLGNKAQLVGTMLKEQGEASRSAIADLAKRRNDVYGLLDKVTSDIGQKDPAMKGRIWKRFAEELQNTPAMTPEQALPIIQRVMDEELKGTNVMPRGGGGLPVPSVAPGAVAPVQPSAAPLPPVSSGVMQPAPTSPLIPPVVKSQGLTAVENEARRAMNEPEPNERDYVGRPKDWEEDRAKWSDRKIRAAENLSQAQSRESEMRERARKELLAGKGITEAAQSKANDGLSIEAGTRESINQYADLVNRYETRVKQLAGDEYDKLPKSKQSTITKKQYVDEAVNPTGLTARLKGFYTSFRGELENDPIILGINSAKTRMAATMTRATDANPGQVQLKQMLGSFPDVKDGPKRMREFVDELHTTLDAGVKYNLRMTGRENDPAWKYLFERRNSSTPTRSTGTRPPLDSFRK